MTDFVDKAEAWDVMARKNDEIEHLRAERDRLAELNPWFKGEPK